MPNFFNLYKKRIALVVSMIIFVIASGYTAIFALNKTITVKINERNTSNQTAKVSTLENVNLNKTVKEVLLENNLPVSDDYDYGVDLNTKIRQIDNLEINKRISGQIQVDGKNINYNSIAQTVKDLLDEKGVSLAPSDSVTPDKDTLLTSDITNIIVHRQTQSREIREEAIGYQTVRTTDSNLSEGVIEVDVPGIEGRKLVTEDVLYSDGKPISRTVVSEESLLEPINQVERVGTGSDLSSSNSGTSQPSSVSYTSGYNGTALSEDDFNLVCAIVEHEGGSNYDSALAVMSCVMNRVDSSSYPNDPVSVLTAPGQFASYLDGYYKQFLNNSSTVVRQAVVDCLAGKRSHNYLNFRSYQTENSEKIGGNWFFND